jgi:hypothetical protein
LIRAIALACALACTRAAADPGDARSDIAAATAAAGELRYDDAVKLVDRAWRRGESSPDEIRGMFALAGIAAGSIGDVGAARLWFQRWLYLEPNAQLPAGTSPKLLVLFDGARKALAGAHLDVHATHRDRAAMLAIGADPLGLVHAARIGDLRVSIESSTAQLDAPDDAVDLLDRYGNVLATIEVVTPPPPVVVVDPTPAVAVHSDAVVRVATPWSMRWSTWAIATGGLVATGITALLVAVDARSQIDDLNRDSSSHEYAETVPLQHRFDRAELVGEVALGGAVVAAAIGSVIWLRTPQGPIAVAPTASGAVVTWQGRF